MNSIKNNPRKIVGGGGSEFWPEIQLYQNHAGRRLLSFRESNLNRKRGERLLAFAEGDVL